MMLISLEKIDMRLKTRLTMLIKSKSFSHHVGKLIM